MLKLISIIFKVARYITSVTFYTLATLVILAFVIQPSLVLNSGKSNPVTASDRAMIHELFPNSSWNDLEPCGLHFDEQKEFNTALQCVNQKVWPQTPITKEEFTHIPRCFIVKAKSPDVFTSPKAGFNFWPIFEMTPRGPGVGAVVGVYQPETRTVYIVENVDAAMVYRHELQHYFLHIHNPETGGGGHFQEIWKQCEPPYYTPSEQVTKNLPTPTATETPSN
jgi:hypothetical protein